MTTHIVYSGSALRTKLRSGGEAKNPAHFTGPVAGVKEVYLNGDHPKIRKAYEQAGVTVRDFADYGSAAAKAETSTVKKD